MAARQVLPEKGAPRCLFCISPSVMVTLYFPLVMDSKEDTEMLNSVIGYCSGHFIFPISLKLL